MKLKITNLKEVNAAIKKQAKIAIEKAAENLFQRGLSTIQEAREEARFYNRTNNLRSSFGVAVSINAKIIKSDFELVGNGELGDGGDGLSRAQKLIGSVVNENRNKLLLVLVAGEKYALYVEAKDNKTVLTTFALNLKKELKK